MSFRFSEKDLRRLFEINQFPIPNDDLVLFGLRGIMQIDPNDYRFLSGHRVNLVSTNNTNPRCTIGQWKPKGNVIALFPGSTVPHRDYIRAAKTRGGVGANELMTGYYDDYRKGMHKAGSRTGHHAFRQTKGRAIRRSADDLDYDNDDRVEFSNPYDNLHAAWCQSTGSTRYASAGCQVIVGYPQCRARGNASDIGPWRKFRNNAYNLTQNSFGYGLFAGRDAMRVVLLAGEKTTARVRFGSVGTLVRNVQKALKEKGIYEGIIDGDAGPRTLRGILEFQSAVFGDDDDDGIVGPVTAEALGIDWTTV